MPWFVFSYNIFISMLAGVTVAVALLSVPGLVIYRRRRTQKRRQEVAEQVKEYLAEMRNSPSPQQERVDPGNYDFEHTGHEAGQRAKESTGEPASQAQGTVGQDADQTRATEAEPWATFQRGSVFDKQGEYDLAEEAYKQAIVSGHPEVAPEGMRNLRGLAMRYSERIRRGSKRLGENT